MEKYELELINNVARGGNENPLNEGIQGWKSVPP